jgi:integrase
MTELRSALERYLNMRQGLGYKYQHQARRLADFVSFMETHKAATITTKLAMAWATLPPDRHASWALRLTDVRGFARHIANIDSQTEVPPAGMLPPLKRAKPYVYSDAEVDALLAAALALPPADGLRRWTYHYLFGLIAVTGVRLSEAIGFQRDDIDLDNGVLTVRQTKFRKSRLVPLHPTTRAALRSYAKRRDAHLGSRCGVLRRRARRPIAASVRPPRLLAIVSGDWASTSRRSHWATRARLTASVRDSHASQLVSQGHRCRATAPGAFHLSRPHLRA